MAEPGIQERIQEARSLFSLYGEQLKRDRHVCASLERFSAAIRRTAQQMVAEGIGEACSACAVQCGGGGCCFRGMEEGFDRILLLINLLMGCDIPETGELPGGCLFVGEKGCRMQAKYHFCLNYFCPDLMVSLSGPRMSGLLTAVGEELTAGIEAEQAIGSWLRKHGGSGLF